METDCNKKCKGHETQTCGGTWRASVYKINKNGQTVSTTTHTPTSQKQRTSDMGTCKSYFFIFINEQFLS